MVPCLKSESDKCEGKHDCIRSGYSKSNRNGPSIPFIQKSRNCALGWRQTKQSDPPQEYYDCYHSEERLAGRHRFQGTTRRTMFLKDVLNDQADSNDASDHASDDDKRELASGH